MKVLLTFALILGCHGKNFVNGCVSTLPTRSSLGCSERTVSSPLPYTTALQGCQGFLSVAWKRSQVMKQHCIRMGYGVQVQLSCLRGMSSFYIQFLQLSRRRISHLASRDGFCLS